MRRAACLLAALALGLAGAATAPAPASASDRQWTLDDCEQVEVSRLGTSERLFNRRVAVDTRVRAVFGNQLIVAGTEVTFRLSPDIRGVAASLDEGEPVRAFGWLAQEQGQRTFYVRRLETRSVDPQTVREELARLRAGGDVEGLYALGDRASASAQGSDALRALTREVYEAAVELERERLDLADRGQVLRLASSYAERLGDRQAALDLLVAGYDPDEETPAEIERSLRDLGAVRYGPDRRWVLYETMKRKEGFVERGGAWVLRERAAFLDAIEARAEDPARRRTGFDAVLLEAAQSGKVLVGMTKREVVKAKGYPESFDRVAQGTRTYDAWTYADGAVLYFENDLLFKR